MKSSIKFTHSVETHDQTGKIMAVYLGLREGKSAKTVEYANGKVFADYDRAGKLLGVEILAPCEVQLLLKIATTAKERTFLKSHIPAGMLVAA